MSEAAADIEEPLEAHVLASERAVNPYYQGKDLVGNAHHEPLRLDYLGLAVDGQQHVRSLFSLWIRAETSVQLYQ